MAFGGQKVQIKADFWVGIVIKKALDGAFFYADT